MLPPQDGSLHGRGKLAEGAITGTWMDDNKKADFKISKAEDNSFVEKLALRRRLGGACCSQATDSPRRSCCNENFGRSGGLL